MKLRLEIWKSSENREERHFFIEAFEQSAYQQSPYVFGYNPQIVSEDTAAFILATIIDAESTALVLGPSVGQA